MGVLRVFIHLSMGFSLTNHQFWGTPKYCINISSECMYIMYVCIRNPKPETINHGNPYLYTYINHYIFNIYLINHSFWLVSFH